MYRSGTSSRLSRAFRTITRPAEPVVLTAEDRQFLVKMAVWMGVCIVSFFALWIGDNLYSPPHVN
jgi:hypothetical protein